MPSQIEPRGIGEFVDRWIFFAMAVLFLLTALAGFIPTSLSILTELEAGVRPELPAALHFHAVLMASWLSLLVIQTWLMATGRKAFHMQLGILGMVLAPAIILAGFVVVPTMIDYHWTWMASAPPGGDLAELEIGRNFLLSLVAMQICVGTLFTIFVALGLAARKRNPGMHKRLMILATAIPLVAGIDRIAFLPTSYPFSAVSPPLYVIAWISPMLLWDLLRQRRFHGAYKIWFALFVPAAVLVEYVWWNPGWMAFAARLMGVEPGA